MFRFTSEAVSEGHPDKICDQVADAILDAILEKDRDARVACEVLCKTGMVLVAGEISTKTWVDVEKIVRKVICDIGYNDASLGFDGNSCAVVLAIGKQSEDISRGVDRANKEIGAGDQGMMFGYASNETKELMPAALVYAQKLVKRQADIRKADVKPRLAVFSISPNKFGSNERPSARSLIALR